MKIGIVYIPRKEEAQGLAVETADWLKNKMQSVTVFSEERFLKEHDDVLREFEVIITFGGDGLVLHVANRVAHFAVGLLRVNFGEVGFLTNIEPQEIYEKLDLFLAGKYKRTDRGRIQAIVKENGVIDEQRKIVRGKDVAMLEGLNELVIGGIRRTVHLRIIVDGEESFEVAIKADGAIFSTETGSTGYCLSAGGPEVHIEAFVVTANNGLFKYKSPTPNSKLVNEKSFVLSNESIMIVEVTMQYDQNIPYVIADSEKDYRLNKGDIVVIKQSPQRTIFFEEDKPEERWIIE